jgi:hypothetical protein
MYFYYNLAAFYYVALSLAVVVAGAYCSRRAEPPEQRKPRSVNLRSNVASGKSSVTVAALRLLSEERSNDQREPDATPKPGTLGFKNDSGRLLVETARHRRIMFPLRASIYTPG